MIWVTIFMSRMLGYVSHQGALRFSLVIIYTHTRDNKYVLQFQYIIVYLPPISFFVESLVAYEKCVLAIKFLCSPLWKNMQDLKVLNPIQNEMLDFKKCHENESDTWAFVGHLNFNQSL